MPIWSILLSLTSSSKPKTNKQTNNQKLYIVDYIGILYLMSHWMQTV